MLLKCYAGVGSRSTPKHIIELFVEFAHYAAEKQWTLYSGAAAGADQAFEKGCDLGNGSKQIFLPWPRFCNNRSQLIEIDPRAFTIVQSLHPVYNDLSVGARKLVARDVLQVLGYDLFTPVDFVLCYTADGCESVEEYNKDTGGTGIAISVASKFRIPVFNVGRDISRADDALARLDIKW